MKKLIPLFLLVAICISCKKHRKITFQGIVTDKYTGLPISGVKVAVLSNIEVKGETKTYFTHTDSKGEYHFSKTQFSDPLFSGHVTVYDNEYFIYMQERPSTITKDDAKWIGRTKLSRDLQAVCFGTVNVTFNVNKSIQYEGLDILEIFTHPTGPSSEFQTSGIYLGFAVPTFNLKVKVMGYTNGKTVLSYNFYTKNHTIIKTQTDTLMGPGCGITIDRTVKIN